MTACRFRLPLLGAAVLLAIPFAAADPPADPLPKGAKLRLGTTRMRDLAAWNGAALTPDGKFLVRHTQKGFSRFDVTTGADAGAVGPKTNPGYDARVEFTADARRILTATYNGATLWDVESGKPVTEVKRQLNAGENGAALSVDGKVLAIGGSRNTRAKGKEPLTALVWDVEKNEKRAEVEVAQNQAASVALSPDGRLLATWGSHFEPNPPKDGGPPDPNKLVQFWDAATGKELAKVSVEGYGPFAVAFAPDGQTVAVSRGSGTIGLLDPRTGTEKRRLFARNDHAHRLAFSQDGKTLATAGADGVVQLWGVADGVRGAVVESPVGTLPAGLRAIRFTGNDRAVVWAVLGAVAVVWEVPSGKVLSPADGHVGGVQSVVFAAGGKELLTGGDDGQVIRWDAATGKSLGDVRFRWPGGFVTVPRYTGIAMTVASDGKTVLGNRGIQGVYDAATGAQVVGPLSGLPLNSRSHLCSDARTLLLAPNVPYPPAPQPKSLKVGVWDVATGARLAEVETPPADVVAATTTPDRTKLVTALVARAALGGKTDLVVTGWELATGKKLGELTRPGGYGGVYLAAAPDNTTVLVATTDGRLLAVDAAAGTVVREFNTTNQRPSGTPVFGPGGRQFAVAFGEGYNAAVAGSARVYDWASGRPVATFRGHTGAILGLAFSPDGKTLATGGADTTVLLWDITGGKND